MGKKDKGKHKRETRPQETKQQLSLPQKIFSKKNIIAAALEICLWGGGDVLGYISPYIKVSLWFIAILLLIWLVIPFRSLFEKLLSRCHRYSHLIVNQRLMTILSISPTLLLAILLFVFAFQPLVNVEKPNKVIIEEIGNITPTHVRQPNTTIYCCSQDNTYKIWTANVGDKQDTVVVTLHISYTITDFRKAIGGSLVTITDGGIGANFIVFKIDGIIPNDPVPDAYFIDTRFSAEKSVEFTAWSNETGYIPAVFVGECPKINATDETRPP